MLTLLLSPLALLVGFQDAAALPEMDPKAQLVLEEFAERLYDPVAEGLESLSFDMILPAGPMGGSMGTLHVVWSATGGASGDFEMSEMLESQLEMAPEGMRDQMKEQISAQMGMAAEQIAQIQINGLVREVLKEGSATLEGAEDGFVKVVCFTRSGDDGTVGERAFYFDDDGLLSRTSHTMEGPMGTMDVSADLTWAPVAEGVAGLGLATSEESGGGQMQRERFVRERLGDFVLVTRIESQAMGMNMKMEFDNFVVNGEPASLPARATEPAAETEPAGEGEEG